MLTLTSSSPKDSNNSTWFMFVLIMYKLDDFVMQSNSTKTTLPTCNRPVCIYNWDWRKLTDSLPNRSIDFICIDPPYGKTNGMMLSGQKERIDWDNEIDWENMFHRFNKVIKLGGTICVFGQQPTYSKMVLANKKEFKYELIWLKNNAAQGFHANKMPLCFTENIAVFIHKEQKNFKRTFNNIATKKQIDKSKYFCRWYAQTIFDWIGISRRQIHEQMGHRKLEFFFCYTGKQFGLLSFPLYEQLIQKFAINKCPDFISYEELKSRWNLERKVNYGIKLDSSVYSQTLSNVLSFSKENEYLHPTQKPVLLMEALIKMFSNPGDLVLDCFMGSGSTGLACLNLGRRFIGSELRGKYFEIAQKRLHKI